MSRPVLLSMAWHDLLFAHWPIAARDLRPLLPEPLEIDTWDGAAWIGVVPFRMSRVRPLRVPLPGARFAFAEINVRTYVRLGNQGGVWFFSLHGGDRLGAWAARLVFGVPYSFARVVATCEGEAVRFESERRGSPSAAFRGTYRPIGPVRHAEPGSFEAFLTDRLSLYAPGSGGRVRRADVEHGPWPLQPAEAEIERNTMVDPFGLRLPDRAPHLMFARRLDVVGRAPVRVGPRW